MLSLSHRCRGPVAARLLPRFTAVLALMLLAACGGGPSPATQPQLQPGTPDQPGTNTPVDDGGGAAAAVNKLTLATPVLAELPAGAEFTAVLSGEFTDEVYQGSCRLVFAPDALEPLSASPGALIPVEMVTLVNTAQSGYVPFAFTGLPGQAGIAPGTGTLLTVRFRVLDPAADTRVRFIDSAEFLQLRDRDSHRLAFDTETVAGATPATAGTEVTQ